MPSMSELADSPPSSSANAKRPLSGSSPWDFHSITHKDIATGKQKKPMVQDNAIERSLRILQEARLSPVDLLIAVFDSLVDSNELYRNELFKEENMKIAKLLDTISHDDRGNWKL